MKKFILIYNPVSGRATFKARLDYMLESFQKRGAMLVVYRTQIDNTGLADFIREVDPEGILVAGGDGTLSEVVNLVVKEKLDYPIAIIPGGTSNDFATYLGIDNNLDSYFDRIIEGRTLKSDLGKVGDQYFVNVASAGMVTSIAHEVDVHMKNAMGKMAYYLRGICTLPAFKPMHLKITADGNVSFDGKAFLFVVVNSGVVASFKNASVHAKLDDGKLDIIIVEACNIPDLMALTTEILTGRDMSKQKHVIYLQAADIMVETAGEVESDLDGERGPMLPMHIETVPSAIELYY